MTAGREDGAILVQVAMLSVVLLSCLGFVVDYGALFVARAQAQDSADAAALAAATMYAFDTIEYPGARDVAERIVRDVTSRSQVWGAAPTVAAIPCDGISAECPRVLQFPEPGGRVFFGEAVTVTRPVDTYFLRLLGGDLSSRTVSATAYATVAPANTSTCVWPIAIPDLFYDNNGDMKFSAGDEYHPPTFDGDFSATGYQIVDATLSPTVDDRLFEPVNMVVSDPIDMLRGAVPVQIDRNAGGGFAANLTSCNQRPVRIGQTLAAEVGTPFSDVAVAADTLVSRDAGASWDPSTLRIAGSCAAAATCDAIMSPRLVVLPVFDPEVYENTRGGGNPQIRIVNFIGFFIEQVIGTTEIRGHLSAIPGIVDPDHPNVAYQWALMRAAVLAR